MHPSSTVKRSIETAALSTNDISLIVDGGHRAIKYTRLFGVQNEVYNEGTHFMIPWFETPVVYDVRAKPRNVGSLTGTKGREMGSG
jgi:regulator of protease activity HflC (stomatin/prohibitin superfamily)